MKSKYEDNLGKLIYLTKEAEQTEIKEKIDKSKILIENMKKIGSKKQKKFEESDFQPIEEILKREKI